MRLIKITCYALYYDPSKNSYMERGLSKYAIVSDESSVRNLAFDAYEEGLKRGVFSKELISQEALRSGPLEVGLFDNNKGGKLSPIRYKILDDGGIKFLDFYESLETDWSITEIAVLSKCKYISGSLRHLAFRLPEGLGSFGDDIAILTNVLTIIGFCLQYGPTTYKILSSKFKKTVSAWQERNISSLKEIRIFLDTKRSWKTEEVMTRLCVDEELAKAIMTKLGFTLKKNRWIFIEDSNSLQVRSEWLKKEEDMDKAQEAFLRDEYNENANSSPVDIK